ncbi:hypothetical protein [Caballeronia sp. LjRoot31]|uniref:hypothetical protein n=1 Tax=Caballeronia sp. LjRoot31 TaxID=3342324 RepID=UPI003ECC74E7
MIIFKPNIKSDIKPNIKPTIKACNTTSTLVLPRTLRAEVKAITDQTGASFGEITRQALTAYVADYKIRMEELDAERTQ